MPLTPQDFVTKWRQAAVNERASAQSHFIDICRLIDHPAPLDMDPAGKFFRFEAGASKTSGGEGFADVWYRGRFAWEYKGKHADLDKAYQQLLQYREALENPPLLIVSDIETIVIHTNFTNTVKHTYTLTLDQLLTPDGLSTLRNAFNNPDALRTPQTSDVVTARAASHFARLAEKLRQMGNDPAASAHFLIQLLFCLFAEDVELLPGKLFSRLVHTFRNRPQTFNASLGQLFDAMATGGIFGVDEIPHFDGHLFDSARPIALDVDCLEILVEVSTLDWSSIEPSIFGTLFERSLDPSKRSQLGAHYTSSTDIMLIIEPVLMQPLRQRWAEIQRQARSLAVECENAARQKRTQLTSQISSLLTSFSAEIASVSVLDPACGSGNFLYLALRSLLDLQKEINAFAYEMGIGSQFPTVTPAQLHGIEINEYAHQLAQATIQIGYIQWLRENGYGRPAEPILKPLNNIRNMDAILAYDDQCRPTEPTWPPADVIIGNPPFLGDKKMRSEMGDAYVEAVRTLYAGRVPGGADLVCYWFEKARAMIEQGETKRAGLLATQSIRVGANRSVLDRINNTGAIFMGWSDRPWILDGAQVRVSLVGFDDGSEKNKLLNDEIVACINSNLTTATDLTKSVPLAENAHLAFIGTQKGGNFEISPDLAQKMLSISNNPNGRPNSDVVKPWINGLDITRGTQHMWIIDFGSSMTQEEAALYEMPFEYVKANVFPTRKDLRRLNHRKYWWIHAESRPGMRRALNGLSRYIATPRVAKYRIFIFVPSGTIPDSRVVVIAREDNYFMGVLHSRIHECWALATSPRHGVGNDPTYSAETCFQTFPFPWPPGKEPLQDSIVTQISEATQELLERREVVLRGGETLTNLYNQRPTWLQHAHRKLDTAVFAAYGWPPDLTDEDILARLLALNLERSQNR
jgi:type II restriction/modification system DNA methylase subunit YeeA